MKKSFLEIQQAYDAIVQTGDARHAYVDTLKNLLEETRKAGLYLHDYQERERYALLSRRIGDTLLEMTGEYFFVSLESPMYNLPEIRSTIPAPTPAFVGRTSEIEQLVMALTSSNGTAKIVGIRGMGGIGKTELAKVVAHRVQSHFPDGSILLNLYGASDPVSPVRVLQDAIRPFAPDAKLPDDEHTLTALYQQVLAGKRVLVLADDAKDAAQVRGLLPPPGCALLITSRHHFRLKGMHPLNLDVLSSTDAETLLRDICPRIGEHAAELAQLCGHLPLALELSATTLETDETLPVATFVERLRTERLKYLRDPDAPNNPDTSVEKSLWLSYQALPAEAQAVLAQLGVFEGRFPLNAAEAIITTSDPQHLQDTLSLLYRHSLLDYDQETSRYDLHDLVREFALARLRDDPTTEYATRLRHARYYQQVCEHSQSLYLEGNEHVLAGLALFDTERKNIDAAWQWAMEQGGEDAEIDRLLLDFADAVHAYYEQARALAHDIGDRQGEANHCWNLGLLLKEQGDLVRAAELIQVAADFYTAINHANKQKYIDGLARVRAALDAGG